MEFKTSNLTVVSRFTRNLENVISELTVAEFIDYLEENAKLVDTDETVEHGKVVETKLYRLQETDKLVKEFTVTDDSRVFLEISVNESVELVDKENDNIVADGDDYSDDSSDCEIEPIEFVNLPADIQKEVKDKLEMGYRVVDVYMVNGKMYVDCGFVYNCNSEVFHCGEYTLEDTKKDEDGCRVVENTELANILSDYGYDYSYCLDIVESTREDEDEPLDDFDLDALVNKYLDHIHLDVVDELRDMLLGSDTYTWLELDNILMIKGFNTIFEDDITQIKDYLNGIWTSKDDENFQIQLFFDIVQNNEPDEGEESFIVEVLRIEVF